MKSAAWHKRQERRQVEHQDMRSDSSPRDTLAAVSKIGSGSGDIDVDDSPSRPAYSKAFTDVSLKR